MNFLTFLLTLLAFSCSSTPRYHQLIADYKKSAQAIVKETRQGADAQKIAEMGRLLIEKAKPILHRVKEKKPACRKVLDLIVEKSREMTQLNLKSIERDYHHGAALPESDDDCYEAKELIVHPATVVILATEQYNTAGKQQIIDEIEELLAHIDMLL